MKIEYIYLCIRYRKRIDMSTSSLHCEIQPGDVEISSLAGLKRYSFIGFPVGDTFDDYGELCLATDDREEAKKFMKNNNLVFDKKLHMFSELLDYHDNFKIDDVGLWKMFSLDGEFEKEVK